VCWSFDQSSGHTAFSYDTLVASRMDVKPGGKQPVIHDTKYMGVPYKIVLADGSEKRIARHY